MARSTEEQEWNGCRAMWAPIYGVWHSSTRAELAVLVMATHTKSPIHIGIDNKAVVEKAMRIIEIAKRIAQGKEEVPEKPLKESGDYKKMGTHGSAFGKY